jgi:hypothetical protein
MTDPIPEPMETQLRKASDARHRFPAVSLLGVALVSLVLDALLLAGGWAVGSPSQSALTLIRIDAALLAVWVVGIPIRRWLSRSPY